jgi:L-malate glycosyltransferase
MRFKGLKSGGMIRTNICFFLGSFQSGGAEDHVLQILRHIDKNKFKCFLGGLTASGQLKEGFGKLNIPTYIANSFAFKRLWKLLWFTRLFSFIRFLKSNKIKIVHIHLVGSYKFALTGAILARIPVRIITWHNIYDRSVIKWNYKKPRSVLHNLKFIFTVRVASVISHKIIAVSNRVKNLNSNFYKISPKKVFVVHNGIDGSRFNLRPKENSGDRFLIGSVGGLQPQKGYMVALEAIRQIVTIYPQVEYNIIGDGPERHSLAIFIKRHKLDENVHLMGWQANIPDQLAKLDLFLMTSFHEGFSIALLEAMASGLPIIATDVGGNGEAILNKKNGILIPPNNVKATIKSIDSLINDAKQRGVFGNAARNQFLENFTVRSMVDKLGHIYLSLMQLDKPRTISRHM